MEQRPTAGYLRGIATEVSWLIVILFIAIGFYSIAAPPPNEAAAPDTFSAGAAMQHVLVIAQEPHPMGTPEIAEVREYIVAELGRLGIEPELQQTQAPDPFFDPGGIVDITNIVARIPGQGGEAAVALMAHYDTMPTTPGANDNSAAVAVLLETAKVMLSGDPVGNDVILLFTDGEEPWPRFGSPAFIQEHPDAGDIGFVVNFEAAGGSGPSMVAEISGAESWIIDQYSEAVDRPVAFSFATEIVRTMGEIGTDFDPFRNAGVPGLHLAYMRGSPIYHTPADNIDAVSLRSLQHHGDNAVGVVRHFGNLDLARPRTDSSNVYFTLRPMFMKYPAWFGWPILTVGAGLVMLAARRRALSPTRMLAATGTTLLAAIAASIVGTLLWIAITIVRETPTVLEAYGYLAIVGGIVIWLTNRATRRFEPQGTGAAAALVWLLLGLLTVAALPGTSYLFVWPVLGLGIALNLQSNSRTRLVAFVLTTAITVPLLVPAIEFFWQFGQPRPGNPDSSLPAVAAVAFLLVALAGAALRSVWWRPVNLD